MTKYNDTDDKINPMCEMYKSNAEVKVSWVNKCSGLQFHNVCKCCLCIVWHKVSENQHSLSTFTIERIL